jgi:hypothetical protein
MRSGDPHMPVLRPMSEDEVFAVLIRMGDGELNPFALELTPESTVHQWRQECELGSWRTISNALNDFFRIHVREQEWRAALVPPKRRTMGDVCALVARHAMTPAIEPVTILGATSASAGAFLALRAAMLNCGIDVSDLRPSTPVEPYLRRHARLVLTELTKLAPTRVPQVQNDLPMSGALLLASFACGIGSWALSALQFSRGTIPLALTSAALFLIGLTLNRIREPRVRLANVRTFKDLSRILAGEIPRTGPAFPVVAPQQTNKESEGGP